jgi:hypothetical protein
MFNLLWPFNAQLLNDGALLVRAFGMKPGGRIERSKNYLLFGNGMASLIPWVDGRMPGSPTQYVVKITERHDQRKLAGKPGATYWEIQGVPNQDTPAPWMLWMSTFGNSKDDRNNHVLIAQAGDPGQCFFVVLR